MMAHCNQERGGAGALEFCLKPGELLGLLLGRMRFLSATQGREMIQAIEALPDQITHVLRQSEQIRAIAEKYRHAKSMLYFGRQMQYGVALEGALKMKEITYIHAEGHPTA